jgi:Tfp pilus tip-associated adhesin PilY1
VAKNIQEGSASMVVSTEGNPSVAFVDLGGDGFVDAAL